MAKMNFARHFYEGRSKPLSAQKLVNLYAEEEPVDATNTISLVGTPGFELFAEVGSGPIWGMIEMGGDLYVVSRNEVFKVNSLGVTVNLGSIGFVGGNVSIAENGTQVAIVKPDGDLHIATSGSVVKVTDPNYLLSDTVTYQDTFFIFSQKNGKIYFLSAQNDGTSFNPLDQGSAESDPDNIVAIKSYNQSLWIFGEISVEVHYNSGDAVFPFEPIRGAKIEQGCAAKSSVATEDNLLFWLGDDRSVYQASGYLGQRISTHAIEFQINEMEQVSDATGFIYVEEGHRFYCLTFPTERKTFVYDLVSGNWHQRESRNEGRWRVNAHSRVFRQNIVGDFDFGRIYSLSLDTPTENGEVIQREVVSAPLFNELKRFTVDRFEVDLQTGVGLTFGQGEDPQAMLQISDDGGQTFGNERWVSYGKIGEFRTRVVWRGLGQSRRRVFRLTISDPTKVIINGAFINIRVGKE